MFFRKKKDSIKKTERPRTDGDEKGERYETRIPAIYLDGVCKNYFSKKNGENHSLVDVNLTIDEGEFVFIIGGSGAGKSTLLKLLTREIKPSAGKIFVKGRRLKRIRNNKIAYYRRNIGMVFQDFKLLKNRNVFENVAFAMEVIEEKPARIKRKVPETLGIVGLLGKEKSFPNELSGGEQQRVAIARAIVNEPDIILADEPTGNLDPKNSQEIMNILEDINKKGTTVIVVTHNHEIVKSMNKRIILMENGRIIQDEKSEIEYEVEDIFS